LKLVLTAIVAFMALGIVSGSSTAQAAPSRPPLHCTGSNSVWDDTDIVHLTKEGAGTLNLAWRARGHTTLDCGTGNPLTGKTARIEQQVDAHVHDGTVRGRAQTRIAIGDHNLLFTGNFTGTTTVNDGVLTLHGDYNADGHVDGSDYAMLMRQAGTLDLGSRHWTSLNIIGVLIDAG